MDPKTQLEKKQKQKNHAALHLMGTKNTIPLWTKMWEQQKYSIPQKVKRQEEKNTYSHHMREWTFDEPPRNSCVLRSPNKAISTKRKTKQNKKRV